MIAQAEPRNAKPPVVRDYLSFSAIRLYQSCPLKYFFRYVAGLPEDSVSSSLVLGSAVHRAIEFHFRELLTGNPPPSSTAILAEFSAEWNSRDLEQVRFNKGENRETSELLGERILSAFQQSEVAQPSGQILAVEEELRGPVVPGWAIPRNANGPACYTRCRGASKPMAGFRASDCGCPSHLCFFNLPPSVAEFRWMLRNQKIEQLRLTDTRASTPAVAGFAQRSLPDGIRG